jgi:hypothetical protein
MATIEQGQTVMVRTADDRMLERHALSEVVMGDDFEIVWVCREEEWLAAQAEGREPSAVPWPAEAVVAAP